MVNVPDLLEFGGSPMLLLEAPGLNPALQHRPLDFLSPVIEQVGGSVSPEHFVL